MHTREVDVPTLSSINTLRRLMEHGRRTDVHHAKHRIKHSPTTLSQQKRTREQEGEANNDDVDTFEFVEFLKEGKEKVKPTPSPGLVSSPRVAAVIVSPVEEKKGKEKQQEKVEETQGQTQEMTVVEAMGVRANTPSMWMVDAPWFPTTSLVDGVPPSGVPRAPSLRPTDEARPPTARISGQGSSTTPESTSMFAPLSKGIIDAVARASLASESRIYTAPITFSALAPPVMFTLGAPSAEVKSADKFNSPKPATDEGVSLPGVGEQPITDPQVPIDLQSLEDMYNSSSWLINHVLEPNIGDFGCPDLAEKYGRRGQSCLTVFLYEDDNGSLRCRFESCSTMDFRTIETGLRHVRGHHFDHRPFECLPENGEIW